MKLSNAFKGGWQVLKVQKFISDSYINGELAESFEAENDCKLYVANINPSRLTESESGLYTLKDLKFYEESEPSLTAKSIIKYKRKKYRVADILDRNDDGGFSVYYAKLDGGE